MRQDGVAEFMSVSLTLHVIPGNGIVLDDCPAPCKATFKRQTSFRKQKSRRTNLSEIRAAALYAITVYQRTRNPASFILSSYVRR